jgi:hypothetical protein
MISENSTAGAQDVAAMATSVGSKALTVKQAIIFGSICEFLGSLIGGMCTEHFCSSFAEICSLPHVHFFEIYHLCDSWLSQFQAVFAKQSHLALCIRILSRILSFTFASCLLWCLAHSFGWRWQHGWRCVKSFYSKLQLILALRTSSICRIVPFPEHSLSPFLIWTCPQVPVSTTHALIGSLVGLTMWTGRGAALNTGTLGRLVASWVVSPVLAAILSCAAYTLLARFVLQVIDSLLYRQPEPEY